MEMRYLHLLAFVLVCELAGGIGSIFTMDSVRDWYPGLEKPAFNPPSWVFGPVWTALYAMMGASAYLVYESKSEKKGSALKTFFLQLSLNVLWSIAFFGLRSPLLGLAVIIALWLAIAWTMRSFKAISPAAAYLLIPYIIWVSFAAILNLSIFMLN